MMFNSTARLFTAPWCLSSAGPLCRARGLCIWASQICCRDQKRDLPVSGQLGAGGYCRDLWRTTLAGMMATVPLPAVNDCCRIGQRTSPVHIAVKRMRRFQTFPPSPRNGRFDPRWSLSVPIRQSRNRTFGAAPSRRLRASSKPIQTRGAHARCRPSRHIRPKADGRAPRV